MRKRQKKDHLTRAFARGYSAGLKGKPQSGCPFSMNITRQSWLSGWLTGHDEGIQFTVLAKRYGHYRGQ